jgi:hypothetical protein
MMILMRVKSGYLKWYGSFFTVSVAVFITEVNENFQIQVVFHTVVNKCLV